MVMSAKTEFWIAVIGLSGRENGESFVGPGKSYLCDRFMSPENTPSPGHTSIISQQDFHGPIVNTDHFLYWGRTRKTVDGKAIEFNIIEQTEFLDDVTFNPFNARDPYMKRATATTINSSRKIQYLSPEQLQDPKSQKAQKFTSRKLHIDGFLCVYDVSKVSDRHAGTQYKFVFELLDLIDVPVVLVATKCDKGRSRHFEEMMYLAKVQKVPIVETSAAENVNVEQAFFSLVRIFNRQVIISKKHIQYFNPREIARARKARKEKKADKKLSLKRSKEVKNGEESEMSVEWTATPPPPPSDTLPDAILPSRDSPLTDSLLSDPPCECPYEHINGDDVGDPLGLPLYENCGNFDSQDESSRGVSSLDSSVKEFSRSSSGGSRGIRQHDTDSRDSQSKTSSEEYIPVPRAAYDPAENYENVRYNHAAAIALKSSIACPSPTSHSSDSEKGSFLTGVPDHMKIMESQRPWESASYYTNVTMETPPLTSDRASTGTRSTSSIDTDCQASASKHAAKPRSGAGNYNGQYQDSEHPAYVNHVISEHAMEPPIPPRLPPRDDVTLCRVEENGAGTTSSSSDRESSSEHNTETDALIIIPQSVAPTTATAPHLYDLMEDSSILSPEVRNPSPPPRVRDEDVDSLCSDEEDADLPPYPEICFTTNEGFTTILNTDLDDLNPVIGDLSSLWLNEPLPPPPPSDFLTPSTIPDFEKTPTNELTTPTRFSDGSESEDNDPVTIAARAEPVNIVSRPGDAAELYENIKLPEIPPRRPALPPRTDIATSSGSRDGSSTRDTTLSRDSTSRDQTTDSGKPELPNRIPLNGRDTLLAPFFPPSGKDQKAKSRDTTLSVPTRDSNPRDLSLPPRDPRDASLATPREDSRTATTLPPQPLRMPLQRRGSSDGNTPRFAPRIPASSHRMPTFPLRQPAPDTRPVNQPPPNLPPRVKADSSIPENSRPALPTPHMPTRVPLPRPSPTTPGGKSPVYSEVERSGPPRVIQRHEFSPYVVPSAPRIDRWEEYTGSCAEKKSSGTKKKVKVKIPQR